MKLIMLIKVYINILEVYNERRSGWSLKQINHLEISSAVYDPILGRTFFTTPTKIKRIRAVVNIDNVDDKCFCCVSKQHCIRLENIQRVSIYLKYQHELNLQGIKFPMTKQQIPRYEAQNYLSITVLGYDEDEEHFYHIYTSSVKNTRLEVELLLLKRHDDSHYVLIRNLSRLLALSKCKGNKYHFCRYCLQGFTAESVLENT